MFNLTNFGVDGLIIYMLMQFKKFNGIKLFNKVCKKKFLLNLKNYPKESLKTNKLKDNSDRVFNETIVKIFMTFLTHAPRNRLDYLQMNTNIENEFNIVSNEDGNTQLHITSSYVISQRMSGASMPLFSLGE